MGRGTMTEKARPNSIPGVPDGATHEPITKEYIKGLPRKNPHQAFIIGESSRPGFNAFMVNVEYTMYEPDTQENAKFELIITKFPEGTDMLWAIMIVPIEDMEKIQAIGQQYEFRFVSQAVPVAFEEGKESHFHIEPLKNVFTVQGYLKDTQMVEELDKHWRLVIEKHQQGVPWKV